MSERRMAEPRITPADAERFQRFLRPNDNGCLIFSGKLTKRGHGHFRLDGQIRIAHRVAWWLSGRSIPFGFQVMHNCPGGDNPACCNPAHLMVGTPAQHALDKAIKWQGRRSKSGYPLGVKRLKGGHFYSRVGSGHNMSTVGTYSTWQEAAALAALAKNLSLESRDAGLLPEEDGAPTGRQEDRERP